MKIINNTVSVGGISINGSPGENNLISGNKAVGTSGDADGYVIENRANAKVEGNEGFAKVDNTPWMGRTESKALAKKKKGNKAAK